MAQASKTFRIFVSSTFNDLKEERNALQKYVVGLRTSGNGDWFMIYRE